MEKGVIKVFYNKLILKIETDYSQSVNNDTKQRNQVDGKNISN